jgi:hypothetical protein
VTDTTRYAARDDDSFFYPEKVTDKGQELRWPAGVRRHSYRKAVDLPAGHAARVGVNSYARVYAPPLGDLTITSEL